MNSALWTVLVRRVRGFHTTYLHLSTSAPHHMEENFLPKPLRAVEEERGRREVGATSQYVTSFCQHYLHFNSHSYTSIKSQTFAADARVYRLLLYLSSCIYQQCSTVDAVQTEFIVFIIFIQLHICTCSALHCSSCTSGQMLTCLSSTQYLNWDDIVQ